jgi:hypothetical protein
MRKGDQSTATYYNKMEGFVDEMAAAGKPLEDGNFISYALAGLDHDYNSFVENVMGKAEISLGALYSQLRAAEAHLDLQQMQHQSSMNSSSHGRSGFRGRGGGGRGGFGHDDTGSSLGTKPVCQLCRKTGHTMIRCWKRFDMNFSRENKMANNAEGPGYNVDTAWYADTGATNHITSELDKLAIHEKYTCHEQIHAANGGGMHITHVGHSTLHTPTRILSLKNVLRVPNSKKKTCFNSLFHS